MHHVEMNNLPPAYNSQSVRNRSTGEVRYVAKSAVNQFLTNNPSFEVFEEMRVESPSVLMRKSRNNRKHRKQTRKNRKARKATRKGRRN